MEKEFVPYELVVKLKELGFNENCFAAYCDNGKLHIRRVDFQSDLKGFCLAPLYQQAFRWFREKYPDLDFGIAKIHNGTNNYQYHINLEWEFFEGIYEEAELACLETLIEVVESKS